MEDRKLATIRRIAEVAAIPGADKICAYRVDGWWVVGQTGEYQVGDLAVYLEVDSWVPTELAPFLSKGKEPREFEGVKGERLRTIRLKGQLSQGLLLSLNKCIETAGCTSAFDEGSNVTEWLGILKWEKPMNPQLQGIARGNFPSFIPKTDQERIQNCTKDFQTWLNDGTMFEVTEKLDGSSMTVYGNGDTSGVCSRNLDLEYQESNSFWKAAQNERLIERIQETGRNIALQGELVGEGIQGNAYRITGQQFFCFDIYDIDNAEYLLPNDRKALCQMLGIKHVPVVNFGCIVLNTIQDMLENAEGMSSLESTQREGLVYKALDSNTSFKAISNVWLLKNE